VIHVETAFDRPAGAWWARLPGKHWEPGRSREEAVGHALAGLWQAKDVPVPPHLVDEPEPDEYDDAKPVAAKVEKLGQPSLF
jgi:hypothetical protein